MLAMHRLGFWGISMLNYLRPYGPRRVGSIGHPMGKVGCGAIDNHALTSTTVDTRFVECSPLC